MTTMRHAQVIANNDAGQLRSPGVCEATGVQLFCAGECVAPGEYIETETGRRVLVKSPDFLPARMDGHIACYRLARGTRREMEEPTLLVRQKQFQLRVAKMYQRLYRFALLTVCNPHDAEDVTQETLARAWIHFDTYDARRPFEAWVFRIARNLLIDQSRLRKHSQEISLDAPATFLEGEEGTVHPEIADSTHDPQECLLSQEISAELQSVLRSLSPAHRTTLRLMVQQYTYEQIAHALHCPVGTVRSRVYRARVLVRRILKERQAHEQSSP